MAESVVVRGTVVGEPGVAVAGWVSLGKKLPQRWLSHTLRIKNEDGHEVTIEGLGADSICPVATREAKWQDIEGEELAKLCSNDAPAPGVEVDFTTAVLRGGEPIVAWGPVLDRGYVGGDSLRGSVEGGVTKIRAHVVALGAGRESLLARGKERFEERAHEAAAAAQRNAKDDKPAKSPPTKRVETTPVVRGPEEALPFNYPLWLALAGIALCALGASLTRDVPSFLLAAASCAWVPRAFDATFSKRFRHGPTAPPALGILFIAFAITASFVGVVVASAHFGKNADPAKVGFLTIPSYVIACLAGATVVGLTRATRRDRGYLDILASAPDHPEPIKDGVWGVSVGRFSDMVLDIGAEYSSGAAEDSTVHESPYMKLTPQATFARGESELRVQLGDAAILTLAEYGIENGIYQKRRGVFIDTTTPAMVAGRATDGVLRKAGEASLIVFASGKKTDVRRALAQLRMRARIAGVLAIGGAACVVAAVVVDAVSISRETQATQPLAPERVEG